MFVGDDWKGSELFSKCEAELKKYGVDVVYFPYTKKVSSTMLREKISNKTPVTDAISNGQKSESKIAKKFRFATFFKSLF